MKTQSTTALYDFPESEFSLGGEFDQIARDNGYASGKAAANDLNLWSLTLAQAIETISAPVEA